MPNWTDNKVVIRGTAENVKRFMDDITTLEANPDDTPDEVYDLTSVNPVPDIYKNMHSGARDIDGVKCTEWFEDDEGVRPLLDITRQEIIDKYGYANGIDWQYGNWGTKWGDCDTEVQSQTYTDTHGTVDMTFGSAWSPPFMLLNDIAIKYDLEITNKYIIEFEDEGHIDRYPLSLKETDELYNLHRKGLENVKKAVDNLTVMKMETDSE